MIGGQIVLLFVLFQVAFSEYNETLTRTKFFPISAASYVDDPLRCIHNAFGKDAELINMYNTVCDTTDVCFAYVGVSHQDKAIFMGFRGSMTVLQLLSEGIDSVLKAHISAFGETEVSRYFFNEFNLTWHSGLKKDFEDLTTKYWDYEIWISGHSLGAAIASLTATAICHYYPTQKNRVKLVTFGQPRIGDFSYALLHDYIVPYSYRVTHSKDLVINLPPMFFLYFFHHQTEIFYDNDMSENSGYKVCKHDEDFDCSIKEFGTSIDDHRRYFGRIVSEFGENDCVW